MLQVAAGLMQAVDQSQHDRKDIDRKRHLLAKIAEQPKDVRQSVAEKVRQQQAAAGAGD
jgi:hypothetical protein